MRLRTGCSTGRTCRPRTATRRCNGSPPRRGSSWRARQCRRPGTPRTPSSSTDNGTCARFRPTGLGRQRRAEPMRSSASLIRVSTQHTLIWTARSTSREVHHSSRSPIFRTSRDSTASSTSWITTSTAPSWPARLRPMDSAWRRSHRRPGCAPPRSSTCSGPARSRRSSPG